LALSSDLLAGRQKSSGLSHTLLAAGPRAVPPWKEDRRPAPNPPRRVLQAPFPM